MTGFKLPTNRKFIDLGPYGGEGQLCIHPLKVGDSIRLREMIKQKAIKDGIDVKTDSDVEELAKGKYMIDTLTETFQACVYAMEDGKERQLTFDEIFGLPVELLETITETINKGSDFPLAQNAGKGQK